MSCNHASTAAHELLTTLSDACCEHVIGGVGLTNSNAVPNGFFNIKKQQFTQGMQVVGTDGGLGLVYVELDNVGDPPSLQAITGATLTPLRSGVTVTWGSL